MAGNENRRRKKIEAKRTKRKEEQRAVARIQSSGMLAKMTSAKNWPIMETYLYNGIDAQGMGSAFISRRGPHDQVAAAIFLVDTYCLGVKDVAMFSGPEWKWKEMLQQRRDKGMRLESISPEALRKLVDGAVKYASSLGIAPHRDWFQACPILGDIDASQCPTEFVFGRDGKPFFMAGPFDTPARVRQIMAALGNNSGDGNYDFVLPISDEGECLEDDDDFDESDEDDRFDDGSVIEIESERDRQ